MPNSKRLAAEEAEFEATPITESVQLKWNGEEFVEDALHKQL
jgi:hypothetical protein